MQIFIEAIVEGLVEQRIESLLEDSLSLRSILEGNGTIVYERAAWDACKETSADSDRGKKSLDELLAIGEG